MKLSHVFVAALPVLSQLAEAVPSKRQSQTGASVNLRNSTGTPKHLASGILFGVPENGDQIPSHFYTDIGFNYLRAGAAQLGAPSRGWAWGPSEYTGRFRNALANYRTSQKYGAQYICLLAALYGDTPDGQPQPGDNNDWTKWDAFVDQFISDMKANGVSLKDWIVDIHNETDLANLYWFRSQAQYLELWRRTFVKLRAAFGTAVRISGPSSSGSPSLNNKWFTTYADYVKRNNVVPDQWSWHMETGGGNMMEAQAGLQAVVAQYGLPAIKDINVNEYAIFDEENPSTITWWISQLERVNMAGCRGNWLNGAQLGDFLASLISKPGAPDNYIPTSSDYFPVGEFQVYKYYNQNMTGVRLGTTASDNGLIDVYATKDANTRTIKVIAGSRFATGQYDIAVKGVSSLGLPTSGSVNVKVWRFDNNGHWGRVDGPVAFGPFVNNYSGDTIHIGLNQYDKETAFAWEFSY